MKPFASRRKLGALLISAVLLASLATPALARRDAYCGRGPCYERHYGPKPYHYGKRHRSHGGDIAAGIIGGVVGLVLLDRLLEPSRTQPHYAPSYDSGYSSGYRQGYDRAQRELYERGRQRGYYDGYRAGNY